MYVHRAGACVCIPLPAAELVELAAVGEDDERDLGVAEHGDLVRLLEQPRAALGEGHLAVDLVLDPLQLHPAPPHGRRPRLPRGPRAFRPRRRQFDLTGAAAKQSERYSRAGELERSGGETETDRSGD